MLKDTRFIFVTGGVVSSLGKGIISASLGKLLNARGYSVTIQKLDPYINLDPGTMNPYEHGECYVTEDGAETYTVDGSNIANHYLSFQVSTDCFCKAVQQLQAFSMRNLQAMVGNDVQLQMHR